MAGSHTLPPTQGPSPRHHSLGHSPGHSHVFLGAGHARAERRTWAVIWLCGAMMVAEIVGGLTFGSIALVADGLHMSTHAGALLLAALAYTYARRHADDPKFTFGTGKLGDLAGFTSAIVLAMIAVLSAMSPSRVSSRPAHPFRSGDPDRLFRPGGERRQRLAAERRPPSWTRPRPPPRAWTYARRAPPRRVARDRDLVRRRPPRSVRGGCAAALSPPRPDRPISFGAGGVGRDHPSRWCAAGVHHEGSRRLSG